MTGGFLGACRDAFSGSHRDLPREGSGASDGVASVDRAAGVPPDPRIRDAACDPAADSAAPRATAPDGTITAPDRVLHAVATARLRSGHLPRVEILQGDMARISRPDDFVWCADAALTQVLDAARHQVLLWREKRKVCGYLPRIVTPA